jgi:hypothetical protein
MTGKDMKDSIVHLLSREPKDHGLNFFLILLCSGIFLPGPLAHAESGRVGITNSVVYSGLLLMVVLYPLCSSVCGWLSMPTGCGAGMQNRIEEGILW